MALTNAERQRRYRERRASNQPVIRYRRPKDRTSRPSRWADAIATLRELHAEYVEWLDAMPEPLRGSALGDKLQAVADVDIDSATLTELDALDLPQGFGRD
jgi:hypothetical protein